MSSEDTQKVSTAVESSEQTPELTDIDEDDSLVIQDDMEEDLEAAPVEIEEESVEPAAVAVEVHSMETTTTPSAQQLSSNSSSTAEENTTSTSKEESSPRVSEELSTADTQPSPAVAQKETVDPGPLPTPESSILAATESVMEKLAAADEQKIKLEAEDIPVLDTIVEVGAETFPCPVSVPGIETEPVSEGEVETEEKENLPSKLDEKDVKVIPEEDLQVDETSMEVECQVEETLKPDEPSKDVELVSEAEEEELLLSEPDQVDELITEAITPPASTPPPPQPAVIEEHDTGTEILDISDPDEGDMLIEDSLAARAKQTTKVIPVPVSPVRDAAPVRETTLVRDITPVSPACQSPDLFASTSVSENNAIRDISPVREITPVREISPVREITPVQEISPAREITPVREISPVRDITPVSPARQSPDLFTISSPPRSKPAQPTDALDSEDADVPLENEANSSNSPELITTTPLAASHPQITSTSVIVTPSVDGSVPVVSTTSSDNEVVSSTTESTAVPANNNPVTLPVEPISSPNNFPDLPVPSSTQQSVSSTTSTPVPVTTSSGEANQNNPKEATENLPPTVLPVIAPPEISAPAVPTSLPLNTTSSSSTSAGESNTATSSGKPSNPPISSRASSQEPPISKKRKIPPTEKPFEPGIIWIKPEPVDADEPQVIPPPAPDQQQPGSSNSGGSRKRRLVEKQVSGLPSAPPNVHVTATQSLGEDVQGQLQKILQSSSSGSLLCSLLAQLPQELTSSLLSKVLHQQQLQNQGQASTSPTASSPASVGISAPSPAPASTAPPVAQGVAVYEQTQSRNVPSRANFSPGYQGNEMSRMSPGKLAQKYPPLPQLPRQSRQQGSRTQSSSSQPFPNLQKTQQLLNESTYLQSQLQNSQQPNIQPAPPHQSQPQSTNTANFQQSPSVRPVQNRSYHPQLANVQHPQNVVPNVQTAPQTGASHVQNVQQPGVQHMQNVSHVQQQQQQQQPSHVGAPSGQQASGTVHHQPNNNVMVGSSNQMQTINSNQYKSNNQGLQPMVIPLSDIQTLVGIDDHNKQTVILSDELNTLRRATNATIIRAGQQQQQQPQQPNRQQPIVGQQQINQMGQQNRPNMGQIPQQQSGMFHSQPGMGPNYVQTHTDTIPHQQKLLPKQPIHRPVAPNRRVGKDKQSNEIICIDSDDEADDGKTSTAARCRVYVRDEEKIAVIFDMMKRKCVKTDSDKVTGLAPNIVTVSQNSLPDLQPIVNVSGNLQGYLVHGQTPFLLTPVSGSSHLFMVHQNGKETPTLKEQSLLPGTILNLKAMLEKDPPALPPLPASSIPTSLTTTSLPHTANPINISTSTVINYQPVFLNQQQGANSQLVYTSSQQPLSRDHASDQSRDGGVQYVVVDKSNNNNNLQVSTASMNTGRLPIVDNKHTMSSAPKQPMAMGGVSRDGFVFHNITFSTAENGTTTRVNPAISPAINPTINAASVFSNQVEARAARVMVGSSTKRYMPIAPAPGGNSSSSSSSHSQRPLLLPNQAPTAQYNTSNQPFIQPAHLQPAQPAHLQPAQPAHLQPAHLQPNQPAHLQPQSGQFPSGHVTTGPGPAGQTIIAQTIPGGYQPFPHEQTLQQNPNFQNIQPQNLQAQRVYNVLNLQPIPQPQVDQQKQMSGHQQQQKHTPQQVINPHPPQQTQQQQQQPNITAQNSASASKNPGDREAKLKMVMNSLSQVLSLPIQQQKEVFKNNPILRQLLMKRNADQEQRKDPPPPYPEQTRPLPKKSTGPPGPGRGSTAASRGQGPSQRTILPKPNEQTTQKSTGEHKMERDAHERWLQLSQEQQSVILAAAKEKVSKLKKNELQLLLNAAYQHMHKVPPDMRKALLIAAQERMDKLSGRSAVDQTAASSTTQAPAPARKPAAAKNKDDDDLVILQEVPCRESRTKVTIRDETGEVVTLLGRPAESLPRQTSRYSQTWRSHFSGCARTRAIVKTAGLPTTLLPDLSVWRERESEAASVTSSCARVRPYHRAVGTKSRIKRTGGTNGQDKRFPVRQEVSKIVTRLRKFHCERSRGTKASELTNVFSLTDEGLDDVAECIARAYAKEKKRIPPSERRRGRPSRQVPVSKPLGPQMPKITVCRSSGETPLHKSAQQGWLESVRQCLQAGEDINVRDNAGWTPLHEATAKNRIDVVTLLLEQNADVNVASSTTGVRPIHDAVLHDYVEIAGLLLAAGADPKLPTFSGKLPSDFCRSTAMSELLDKYIAKLSSSGATPPGWSAECLMELSDLPHMPVYKLALQGDEEKNYYLLTDLIARLNISRSTFSQNYPAFKTYRMKWKDFAKLLGKSPYFVHPERLPSQVCEFIELNDDANRILNIRSEMFEP